MRRGSNEEVWRTDDGIFIGLSLGADYCAEHEWGIAKLKSKLGMNAPNYKNINSDLDVQKRFMKLKTHITGLDALTISKHEDIVNNLDTAGYVDKKSGVALFGIATKSWHREGFEFSNLRDNWYNPERSEIMGWWDEGTFAFLSPNKQDVQDIADAFEKNDIAIFLGGGGAFKNAGLVISIASRLPEEFKESSKQGDIDYIALQRAAIKTGIHKKLIKADKQYYALSPKWKDEDKTELTFWLNPNDQRNVNYGWVSVAELEAWCKDEGPIPKVAEKVS